MFLAVTPLIWIPVDPPECLAKSVNFLPGQARARLAKAFRLQCRMQPALRLCVLSKILACAVDLFTEKQIQQTFFYKRPAGKY
jgi:hypothetical protein